MRDKLQHMVQLVLQQHLVVCHGLYQGRDAFVGGQHILGACSRQRSQDELQMFTPGVENMAQGKLLHGNAGDNHS